MSTVKTYHRDSYKYNEYTNPALYTHQIVTQDAYKTLEKYIDELVDFATEIREHEPTWKKEKLS